MIASLVAGTVLVMWIGELITERGIGNGISFIIFAGIVAKLPSGLAVFLRTPDLAAGIAFAALGIGAVAAIVYIQEGQRRIPIQYASRVRGRRMYQGGATFLPLRVNQAGVIPDHLRRQHPAVPGPAGDLLPELRRGHRLGHLERPSSSSWTSTHRCTSCCTSCSPSASRTSTRPSRSSRTRRPTSCARTAASSRASDRVPRHVTTCPRSSTGSASPGRSSWASWP